MEDENDGGRIAIKGFVIQTIASLLEGIQRPDLMTLSLEPSSHEHDGDTEQVDFELVMADGKKLACQVKGSVNPVGAPKAKKWAKALRKKAKADQYLLAIYAPATKPLAEIDNDTGVDIRVASGDVGVLLSALGVRAARLIEQHAGLYPIDMVIRACEVWLGSAILGAFSGKVWTRIEIIQTLVSQVELEHQKFNSLEAFPFDVRMERFSKGATNGSCEDYFRFIFCNSTGQTQAVGTWVLKLTDHKQPELVGLCTHTELRPKCHVVDVDSGHAVEIQIVTQISLEAGETGFVAIRMRRKNGFSKMSNGVWQFHDPLLAGPVCFDSDTLVEFPESGQIQANREAQRDGQRVRWEVAGTGTFVELAATLDPGVDAKSSVSALVEMASTFRGLIEATRSVR